jgi:hypothetical protein
MLELFRVEEETDLFASPALARCACGPLATRRKRMAVACRCAGRLLDLATDRRVGNLLEVGRRYAARAATQSEVERELRGVEAAGATALERAAAPVWTLFEGLRAAESLTQARSTRAVTGAIRWALGLPGGASLPVPAAWPAVREAVAAQTAPVCDPEWRTADVLALARLVRDGGDTGVLPILADALQDAGCYDEQILGHCRESGPHTHRCWVPDLILDAD